MTWLRRGKLEWLRAELQKGIDSGPETPLDMGKVRAAGLRLLAKRRAEAEKKS